MKVYSDFSKFSQAFIRILRGKGLGRALENAYNVEVLSKYRIAAAFVIPILSLIKVRNAQLQECINKTLAECEAVLADNTIFVLQGDVSNENSEHLDATVKKADVAISHAGNLCNNFIPGTIPEEIHVLALRARDICDRISRRVSF